MWSDGAVDVLKAIMKIQASTLTYAGPKDGYTPQEPEPESLDS